MNSPSILGASLSVKDIIWLGEALSAKKELDNKLLTSQLKLQEDTCFSTVATMQMLRGFFKVRGKLTLPSQAAKQADEEEEEPATDEEARIIENKKLHSFFENIGKQED